MYDIAIIGAGAAGVLAAISAKKVNEDLKICIIDSNNEILKKVKITGGGRCNFTNNKDISQFFDHVVTNEKFLYSALYTFTNEDMKTLVKSLGVEYIIEKDNEDKVYVKSGKSSELINAIQRRLLELDIKILYVQKVLDIKGQSIKTSKTEIEAKKIIVATGGCSVPQTGSDGSMLKILENKGYKITRPVASLTPLNLRESFMQEIPGISLSKVDITVGRNLVTGGLVFTHKGIGGPVALKASAYLNRKVQQDVVIDFAPELSKAELLELVKKEPKKSVFQNLKGSLPTNFLKAFLGELDLIEGQSANLSKKKFEEMYKLFKECKVEVKSIGDIKSATVTSGGISVKEVDPGTMESKKEEGLYFAGEIIDVDALTGGYNLQIAFSTGYLAGLNAAQSLSE